MKLTVLGSATPYPQPNNPCSGYLISAADTAVLLDCGPGVFAALLEHIGIEQLTAVWISHMHPDHCGDLAALANWAMNTEDAPKLRVFGPADWDRRLNSFISPDPTTDLVSKIFDVKYLNDGETVSIGTFKFLGRLVQHSVPTYGVRVVSEEQDVFAYSADTGMCEAVAELAQDADLFLCEAGSNEPVEYHLTPQQAQDIARRSRARRLLLTHVPPGVAIPLLPVQPASPELALPGGEWRVGS